MRDQQELGVKPLINTFILFVIFYSLFQEFMHSPTTATTKLENNSTEYFEEK